MSTSARMLQLLQLLQTHRYWPGPELAGRLEDSPRTLRRDVERLRDLGYPVDADRGLGWLPAARGRGAAADAPGRRRGGRDRRGAAVQAAVRGWGRAEAVDGVTCRLHLDADSFDWVVLLISLVGADVEVEHPPELRDVLAATGARLVRAAAGSPVDDGEGGDGGVG